jgi:neutral trehalase
MAALYPDSKAFPDAVPKASPETILADFRREQPKPPGALKSFVAARFELPSEHNAAPALLAAASITAHIDGLWSVLTRESASAPRWSSLLPLPRPYVVPGGRFREILLGPYFTMLGLRERARGLAKNVINLPRRSTATVAPTVRGPATSAARNRRSSDGGAAHPADPAAAHSFCRS